MSAKILAIETSTNRGSVAIAYDKEILSREMDPAQKPSLGALPSIESLLAESGLSKTQLDAVSCGQGPGSFTGVRLATSIVQMLAFGLNIPVIPVSTLKVLAQQGWRTYQCERLLPALDARLNQVYWGYYQYNPTTDLVSLVGKEKLESVTELKWPIHPSKPGYGIGDGWDHYAQHWELPWIADGYPKAYDVATIARYEYREGNLKEALAMEPFYMRNQLVKPFF